MFHAESCSRRNEVPNDKRGDDCHNLYRLKQDPENLYITAAERFPRFRARSCTCKPNRFSEFDRVIDMAGGGWLVNFPSLVANLNKSKCGNQRIARLPCGSGVGAALPEPG